ncbi:MAG: VIT domain-containing protein [Chloroflexota bacterium]
MNKRLFTIPALLIFVISLIPSPALADGIIIPDPIICPPTGCPSTIPPMAQLAIRYHHVTVTIKDQIAVTRVDQVFYNPNDWQVEGTYVFPIPQDAVVSNFVLWINAKPVDGQVLDATQARLKYEEIVTNLRDPALLEYVGRGAVQAHIFPIPPQGERRIELEYSQVLTADNGLIKYSYPLNTEKFSVWPLDSVTIKVDISSSKESIRTAYSPTHNIDTIFFDKGHVTTSYEASNLTPDADFTLFYSIGESEAFHLLTYRDPAYLADPDGFFMLLLAPRPDAVSNRIAKDIILVLDHSGSMEGEKFQQAQEALKYILGNLNQEDRFNIVSFSTSVETFARNLRPAQEASTAIDWINRQSAVGSTDINRALLEAAAMSNGEHPTYIIFLTDGLPTEGEIDSTKIINNFSRSAPEDLRLFAFGVGYDVDTYLLDSLTQEHHGNSTYVKPGDRLDEVLSAFYSKISTPVLTNLSLDFGNLDTYDIYPSPLPDLFAGSQIVVTGRYSGSSTTNITLKGQINGQTQTFNFSEQVFLLNSNDPIVSNLPRLWATRKIGYLLNQIRLHGPDQESIEQIVRLSIRYGIVTPYTSYLVTEDMPLGAAEQQKIANEQYSMMATAPAAPAYGASAVDRAAEEGKMTEAETAAAPYESSGEIIKIIGAHTFINRSGVWIDTGFDPENMKTTRVSFLSEDYFALSAARPILAAAFALGPRVIALSDGIAYEVVDGDVTSLPIEIPATYTPESTPASNSGKGSVPIATPNLPCASSLLAFMPFGLLMYLRRLRHSCQN